MLASRDLLLMSKLLAAAKTEDGGAGAEVNDQMLRPTPDVLIDEEAAITYRSKESEPEGPGSQRLVNGKW